MKCGKQNRLLLGIGVAIIVSLSAAPFAWFALLAFKSHLEITAIPPTVLPERISFEAVSEAIFKYNLLHYFKNSLIVAGITTAFSVAIGTLAAYPLARISIKFKKVILMLVLASGMFPQISIAGPIWFIIRWLGWLNTYQGLILPYLALTLPITVWIIASFFNQLPRELEEAAKVDGASMFQILFRIVAPVAAPGIFTAAILTFVYCWNEFFFALLMMTRSDFQTLPIGIALFQGEYTMPWGEIAAASILTTMPLIVMVLAFQKQIISGLTAGVIKS